MVCIAFDLQSIYMDEYFNFLYCNHHLLVSSNSLCLSVLRVVHLCFGFLGYVDVLSGSCYHKVLGDNITHLVLFKFTEATRTSWNSLQFKYRGWHNKQLAGAHCWQNPVAFTSEGCCSNKYFVKQVEIQMGYPPLSRVR